MHLLTGDLRIAFLVRIGQSEQDLREVDEAEAEVAVASAKAGVVMRRVLWLYYAQLRLWREKGALTSSAACHLPCLLLRGACCSAWVHTVASASGRRR